jgi:hypothetical protein
LRQLLPEGAVWTTPELNWAALWAAPGRWKTTVRQDAEQARCLLYQRLIGRAPMVPIGLLGSQED